MSGADAPWWEEAFRADYLRVYAHRDDASAAEEVAAWTGELPGLVPGARVLDLCCGAGRHLRALAGAGVRAVGMDLSADLLVDARRRSSPPLVRGDMRALPFRTGTFDAVVSFFTSFGYFETAGEDFAVLAEAARVLREGGGYLLDLPDPETVRRSLIPSSRRERDGVVVEEERRLADGGARVEKTVVLRGPSGERTWTESVRLHDPDTVERAAAERGLVPLGRSGGHGPVPWTSGGTDRAVLRFRRECP